MTEDQTDSNETKFIAKSKRPGVWLLSLGVLVTAAAIGAFFFTTRGNGPSHVSAAGMPAPTPSPSTQKAYAAPTPTPQYTGYYFSFNNGAVAVDQYLKQGYINYLGNLRPTYLQVSLDGGTYRAVFAVKGTQRPTRAVVLLHGVGMKADNFLPVSQWDSFAVTQKNLAVFSVEGLGAFDGNANLSYNAGETVVNGQVVSFCCYYGVTKNINDEAFVQKFVAHLRTLGFTEVDVVGFSNGAMMAMRLACDLPTLANHTAAFAGTVETPTCPHAAQLRQVYAFNGTRDKAVPATGPPFNFFGLGLLNSVAQMKKEAGTRVKYISVNVDHQYPTIANSGYNGTCQAWNYFGHPTVCK